MKMQSLAVLKLPPYLCQLNQIKLTWAQVKAHVFSNNNINKINCMKPLLEERLKKVSKGIWQKFIDHVKKEGGGGNVEIGRHCRRNGRKMI